LLRCHAYEDRIEADLLGQLRFGAHLVDALLQVLAAGWVANGGVQAKCGHVDSLS
jgi:hypothetical protein